MVKQYYGTGRNKSAVARVFVSQGTGKFIVNGLELNDFIKRTTLLEQIMKVLKISDTEGMFDIKCTVKGGGDTGQARAIQSGLSVALIQRDVEMNPETLNLEEESEEQVTKTLKRKLKEANIKIYDPRRKERKKTGLRGARAREQYSKR